MAKRSENLRQKHEQTADCSKPKPQLGAQGRVGLLDNRIILQTNLGIAHAIWLCDPAWRKRPPHSARGWWSWSCGSGPKAEFSAPAAFLDVSKPRGVLANG